VSLKELRAERFGRTWIQRSGERHEIVSTAKSQKASTPCERPTCPQTAQQTSSSQANVVGKVGWTGGFGIDDKWLGDGHSNGSWRETNVRFEGPAVRQLKPRSPRPGWRQRA
jgi:phosphatidylserine/phosphatidylglycerophosphate/cardiolipin synthase-like enzyme